MVFVGKPVKIATAQTKCYILEYQGNFISKQIGLRTKNKTFRNQNSIMTNNPRRSPLSKISETKSIILIKKLLFHQTELCELWLHIKSNFLFQNTAITSFQI